jgi:hypothetical protein
MTCLSAVAGCQLKGALVIVEDRLSRSVKGLLGGRLFFLIVPANRQAEHGRRVFRSLKEP